MTEDLPEEINKNQAWPRIKEGNNGAGILENYAQIKAKHRRVYLSSIRCRHYNRLTRLTWEKAAAEAIKAKKTAVFMVDY